MPPFDAPTDALLYGLHVRSELPLHVGHAAEPHPDPGAEPDVVLLDGGPAEQATDVPGTTIIDLRTDDRLCTGTRQTDGTHHLRFHGVCDFTIGPDLSTVTVQPVGDDAREWAALLATGTAMATLLTLRGQPVIHASAVHLGTRAVAFMGRSGMGKSTMASLCCADGATMVVDDVVTLDMAAHPVRCHRGPTEARLRPTAGDLAAHFVVPPVRRTTTDGRHAVALQPSPDPLPPLAAIVIPVPDHDADASEVHVERLSSMDAMLALLEFPRVLGWQDAGILAQLFDEAADIAQRVPITWARLPWGPPFPEALPQRLWDGLAAIGIDVHDPVPAGDDGVDQAGGPGSR